LAIGGYVMQGIPFITYFPAIVLATLLGGPWPGMFAVLLSGVIAWFLFIPPEFTFAIPKPDQDLSLLFFFLVSALLVGLVAALNSMMDRLLLQEEKIRAEIEQRRRSEFAALRLAAIVETSDHAIVAKDLNGIITSRNRGTERLFGYTADEVIGKPINILIPRTTRNLQSLSASAKGNASITTRRCGGARMGI
jgi:PAS domain-containing protein